MWTLWVAGLEECSAPTSLVATPCTNERLDTQTIPFFCQRTAGKAALMRHQSAQRVLVSIRAQGRSRLIDEGTLLAQRGIDSRRGHSNHDHLGRAGVDRDSAESGRDLVRKRALVGALAGRVVVQTNDTAWCLCVSELCGANEQSRQKNEVTESKHEGLSTPTCELSVDVVHSNFAL